MPRPAQKDTLVIAGGRVLDPGRWNGMADIWIRAGRIVAVTSAGKPLPLDARCVDAVGLLVVPGFVDLHVHLREPGFAYKETIATGTAAAAAGGFTAVCCMPNTNPVNDSPDVTGWITERARAGSAQVYPVGAITKGSRGREVNDFSALKAASGGAVPPEGAAYLRAVVGSIKEGVR